MGLEVNPDKARFALNMTIDPRPSTVYVFVVMTFPMNVTPVVPPPVPFFVLSMNAHTLSSLVIIVPTGKNLSFVVDVNVIMLRDHGTTVKLSMGMKSNVGVTIPSAAAVDASDEKFQNVPDQYEK
jgi:hypothetical protein